MTRLIVLAAIELEARALARQLELPRIATASFPLYEGRVTASAGDVVARLRVAPVGLRAELLPERWAAVNADWELPLVISAGACGALAPTLSRGDLILPESVLGPSGVRLNVTPSAHRAAVEHAPHAETGLLLTTADVAPTPQVKRDLWRATGAAAADMESAAILDWAARHGCPSLVVRAVADTAAQELPEGLIRLVTPQGKLRIARAMALAVTSPGSIPQALLLHRGTSRALRSVARLLAALAG